MRDAQVLIDVIVGETVGPKSRFSLSIVIRSQVGGTTSGFVDSLSLIAATTFNINGAIFRPGLPAHYPDFRFARRTY